ncbi:hypothetical protein M407DRAFT_219875 [Tulasnella calospora MUT 4182]|uniref:Uncharacterized protein n=1 Tax=Tulasnella calospora MUT 4182 TaxID=1051891 RepID=A0A0C3QRS5_9AGAM|nr:hypothetical protein M407DRAFT_219875 [Tulasnella calospora MUT 4182]
MGLFLLPTKEPPETVGSVIQNCHARPKSQEADDDGAVITQPYCGVRCSLASQRYIFPTSTITAPAAASIGSDTVKLRMERGNTSVRQNISLKMQERWKSGEHGTPQIKGVYRIELSGQVYRRFDTALSFGDLPYGALSRDGAYGSGLYTFWNPALAHLVAVSGDGRQAREGNSVLIQCRVVTHENSRPSSKSPAGFMDDSGVVFCAQATAVIPTHLLIYCIDAPPNSQQPEVPEPSVNSGSREPSRASHQKATRHLPAIPQQQPAVATAPGPVHRTSTNWVQNFQQVQPSYRPPAYAEQQLQQAAYPARAVAIPQSRDQQQPTQPRPAEQRPQVQQRQFQQHQTQTQQQQQGPPYVWSSSAEYPHPNATAWARYYAMGGTNPAGRVYFKPESLPP